jgi:hypothetical protein
MSVSLLNKCIYTFHLWKQVASSFSCHETKTMLRAPFSGISHILQLIIWTVSSDATTSETSRVSTSGTASWFIRRPLRLPGSPGTWATGPRLRKPTFRPSSFLSSCLWVLWVTGWLALTQNDQGRISHKANVGHGLRRSSRGRAYIQNCTFESKI